MFSVAPNIVLAPNMTQNAERKHRTQDTNTAPIRPLMLISIAHDDLTPGTVYTIGKHDIIHSYLQCLWIAKLLF